MFGHIPGCVIHHHPRFRGSYIGSPSICVLSPTEYVVSHDLFGPTSKELTEPVTRLWHSKDAGMTWQRLSSVSGAFWSRLFKCSNELYLFGTNRQYGELVIRRSLDNGRTWSVPADTTSGFLASGQFHMAPTPVLVHEGKIYVALERADGPVTEWGKRFGAMVMSVPIGTDLLAAASWRCSNTLSYQSEYLQGQFGGWLEGNVVKGPDNILHTLLRVENDSSFVEHAALTTYNLDANQLSFGGDTDFVEFPGGSKKFSVQFDPVTNTYLALSNIICEPARNIYFTEPDQIRNTVALVTSKDLRNWQTSHIVLETPDINKTAFQYIDFAIIEDDIVFVSRTAAPDWYGGAHSYHDANFLTFHRIGNFRQHLG